MNRRQALAATGTAMALVLAGCLGDDENDDGTDDGTFTDERFASPEAVVEAYYETETEDEVSELLHSESERRANPPGEDVSVRPISDASVVEENLSAEELGEFSLAVSEGNLTLIADQHNAAVELRVELSLGDPDDTLEVDVRWLTAQESDGWRIVDDLEG